MRPWLAWSAPAFTHQALNNVPKVSYHMMDWQSLLNKKWGEGDAQVDGSIMAARTVDASYSLFSSIKTSTPEPGIQERRFNGIYLGGEKLWLGDPARLKNGSGFDVIVLSEIIERTKTGYGGQSTDPTIQVVGDVFQLNNVPATQQQLPSDTGLPQRMREDLKQRNLVAIAARRPLVYWKLVQSLARFGIENIKGRWYEPTTLLPILHGEDYARKKAEGDIEDTGKWMNSRGDAQQDAAQKNLLVPKADRLAALGKAVPPGTGILDGIDPPSHEELTAVFARMAGTGGEDAQHSQQQVEPVALEEFMDFEKMAADAYGSQYTGQHFGGA